MDDRSSRGNREGDSRWDNLLTHQQSPWVLHHIDQPTSRGSKYCESTLCRANKHIEVVLLECFINSALPPNQPGMVKKKTVSLRINFKRGCAFEQVLTRIPCESQLAAEPSSLHPVGKGRAHVKEVLSPSRLC